MTSSGGKPGLSYMQRCQLSTCCNSAASFRLGRCVPASERMELLLFLLNR